MSAHRTLDGAWAACEDRTCPLIFHVQLSVDEARILPEHMFEQLAEAVDPPSYVEEDGTKEWSDAEGRSHRDYDLPSTVMTDGSKRWAQHGKGHRAGDKPCYVQFDGYQVWMQHGRDFREDGKPTRVYPDGAQAWFASYETEEGQKRLGIHRISAPARINADGSEEYWLYGERVG